MHFLGYIQYESKTVYQLLYFELQTSQSKNSVFVIEHESSLPSLQEPKIGPYHEPHKSSQKAHTLIFQDLEPFSSCFPNENLYIFFTAHTHSICPSNLIFLYLVTLIFH